MAVKRKYRLNLRNYGNLPAIMLSQYDEGYALEFEIRDGTDAAGDLSAYTVTLKGTRADTLAYSFAGTVSTNVLTFVIDTTMTACAGRGTAEIAIKDTANDVLFATFNMPVFVERAAVPEGSIDADVERAQEIAEQVQEIVDNAAAAVSGEAEKWATGQIDGTDVPSTDPAYENNAKYYAEQAADAAASIGIDATLTQAGKAADSKKTGDEITSLKEDLNGFSAVAFHEVGGYIKNDGTTVADTLDGQKYTNWMQAKQGDVFDFSMSFNANKTMWSAYATYNASGTFIERVMMDSMVIGNRSKHLIPIGEGVAFIAFTYKSYSESTPIIQRYSSFEYVHNASEKHGQILDIANLYNSLDEYVWEVGSIVNGYNNTSDTRCRTAGNIPVRVGDVIICNDTWYYYVIVAYTASGTYISATDWMQGQYIVSNAEIGYIRIVMRNRLSDTITTSDLAEYAGKLTYIKHDIWESVDDARLAVDVLKVSEAVENLGENYPCELGLVYRGEEQSSTTRIRTDGYIPFTNGAIIPSNGYKFAVLFYDIDKKWMASFDWKTEPFMLNVPNTRYIRVCMAKPNNTTITNDEIATIAKSFTLARVAEVTELPDYFANEVVDCRDKLESYCIEKSLVFALVTDSHVHNSETGNANVWWDDTIKNIKAVNEAYPIDAIVHLGDMITGAQPVAGEKRLLRMVRNDLDSTIKPAFMLVGNHDDNFDYSAKLTQAEMYAIYCRQNDKDITARPTNKLYWYKDYDSFGIRVIFLSSHMGDNLNGRTGESWGYPQDEITWFTNEALNTDKQVLLLSHMPFSQGYVSFDADSPINGDLMKNAVDAFIANGGVVIGLINGHTHFDYVHDNGSFYEISQGAETNTENTADKTGTNIYGYAPASAIQYGRTAGTLTQDLWNILVVRQTSRTCKLIRFGAGDDVTWSY